MPAGTESDARHRGPYLPAALQVGTASGQLSSVQALPDVNWQEGGSWQVWQLGTLKLEWGEALTVASKSRSGLSLSWPASAARSRF